MNKQLIGFTALLLFLGACVTPERKSYNAIDNCTAEASAAMTKWSAFCKSNTVNPIVHIKVYDKYTAFQKSLVDSKSKVNAYKNGMMGFDLVNVAIIDLSNKKNELSDMISLFMRGTNMLVTPKKP